MIISKSAHTIVMFLFASMVVSMTTSCDKIDEPYGRKAIISNDTGIIKRKILLEDFTGHTCGNCPEAAAVTQQLVALYGDLIVPIGVHVGFFAEPVGSKYSTDYRTTPGNDIASYFGVGDALPKGMVNRRDFDGKRVLDHADWSSKVSTLINQEAELSISGQTTYEKANRKVNLNLNFTFVESLNENLRYIVYILEDSLHSPQKNYAIPEGEVLDYYHRHVLRASVNGSWGESFGSEPPFTKGQKIQVNKSFILSDAWNDKRMSLAVVVYRSTDREVIQAESIKIGK